MVTKLLFLTQLLSRFFACWQLFNFWIGQHPLYLWLLNVVHCSCTCFVMHISLVDISMSDLSIVWVTLVYQSASCFPMCRWKQIQKLILNDPLSYFSKVVWIIKTPQFCAWNWLKRLKQPKYWFLSLEYDSV